MTSSWAWNVVRTITCGGVAKAAEGRRGGNAVHSGHPEVHQDDIGPMRLRGCDGVGAVGSLAHHLHLL